MSEKLADKLKTRHISPMVVYRIAEDLGLKRTLSTIHADIRNYDAWTPNQNQTFNTVIIEIAESVIRNYDQHLESLRAKFGQQQ